MRRWWRSGGREPSGEEHRAVVVCTAVRDASVAKTRKEDRDSLYHLLLRALNTVGQVEAVVVGMGWSWVEVILRGRTRASSPSSHLLPHTLNHLPYENDGRGGGIHGSIER